MKRFVWLFLIVVIVAGVWSAGWFFAAAQVRQGMERLAANDGEIDPRLTCGTLNVTGFPFRIDIDCADAVLVAEDLTVNASGLRLSAQVYNPTHVLVSARAPITTSDAFFGTSSRLNFADLQGSARLTTSDFIKGLGGDGWRIARVSVVGNGLDWVETTAGSDLPQARASHAELQVIDVPELHDAAAGTAALAIYAVAKDVVAPGFQINSGNGEVQLQVTGLPDDIRRFGDAGLLAAWQAAGGKIEVARINGTDGEDLIDASGTLGLDANRMLEGDITYANRGIRERLAPYVNPMILAVAAGLPQEDGTFKQALQFSGGAIRIGGIPLANLEPLY